MTKTKNKGTDAIRTVACYARVSTASKEQASSFENQQSFFVDFIKKSKRYKLHDIYADKGISGTLLKRKAFEEMLIDAGLDIVDYTYKVKALNNLSDAADGKPTEVQYREYLVLKSERKPKFTEILVRNTSRFARNILVTDILRKLRDKGVYVRFLDIDKTTENESDITVIQLFQTFDELFVRDLSRKVLAGNERSIANKVLRSNRKLYGFKYTQRPNLQENNRLDPIPHEALVVQKIFRLYNGCFNPEADSFIGCDFACSTCTRTRTKGFGIRRVINYLTDNGIKTRNKKNFGSTTLKNILSNEKYAGFINTGKYDSGTIFNKTSPKVRDEYLLELDPVNIDPIISPELFYLCDAIRASRITVDKKGISPSLSNYGGGFLKCAICGSNYQHNIDRGNPFYLCGLKKSKGSKACNAANVQEEYIIMYLQDLLNGGLSIFLYSNYQTYLVAILNAVHRRLEFINRNRDEDKLSTLLAETARLDKRLSNLYVRVADEDGDTTTLNNLITETKEVLSVTTLELEKYTKKPIKYLDAVSEKLLPYAKELLDYLTKLQDNLKQTYTQEDLATVDHLVVHGTTKQLGGKPSPVDLKPVLVTDEEIDNLLSDEDSDLKTYKPIKFKPNAYAHMQQNLDGTLSKTTTNKKGADALNADPTNVQLFSITALKEQFDLLSETLEALQGLY